MRTETPVGCDWSCQKRVEVITPAVLFSLERSRWQQQASDSAFRELAKNKIEFNSSWRKLLFPILQRDSGVSSSVVDAECWRSWIGWHSPVCDLYVFKLGVCSMVKTKTDFFNAQLWMKLKLSVFSRGDEHLLEGTGNEIPVYFLFHTFCHYVPHGASQPWRCWGLTTPSHTHISRRVANYSNRV